MQSIRCLAAILLLLSTSMVGAHPGGLDASGCHNNRKTGDYHCHRSGINNAVKNTHNQSVPHTPPNTSNSHSFRNCTQARAAGVTPIHIGEPGYAPHLDRDKDGIACE